MGIYAVKPRFRVALRGLEHLLIAWGVSADQLTVAGLGCALAAAGTLVATAVQPWLALAVPPLVVARLMCNALDGMLAPTTGTARPLGQVLNEMCDRLADVTILVAACVRADAPALGLVSVASVLLASAAGVTSAAAGGTRQYGGVMGKADRMLLLAIAMPVTLVWGGRTVVGAWLAAVAAGSAVTLIQRCLTIRQEFAPRARR